MIDFNKKKLITPPHCGELAVLIQSLLNAEILLHIRILDMRPRGRSRLSRSSDLQALRHASNGKCCWAVSFRFLYYSFTRINGKRSWSFLDSFILISILNSCSGAIENSMGASWAVSLRFPYWILIKTLSKMALQPPGQFASHLFIKSLLKLHREWPWSLLSSLPPEYYVSFI